MRANHFRIRLQGTAAIYQYPISIEPDDIFEASNTNEIFQKNNRRMYRLFGPYAPSGKILYTMQPIKDEIEPIEIEHKGRQCVISIDISAETMTHMNSEFLN